MYKLTIFFVFLFFAIPSYGQDKQTGIVYDVGSRIALENVSVQATNSKLLTKTDASGGFQLFLKYAEADASKSHYYVLENTFYWAFEQPVSVQFLTATGVTILGKTPSKSGSLRLPTLPVNYYFIQIKTPPEHLILTMFFDGHNYHLVKKKKTQYPHYQGDTSLVFSKSDYYDRTIKLPNNQTSLKVNILKKAYDSLDYFNELIRYEAFHMLQSSPPVTNYGEIESVKVLYDFVNDVIYYSNTKKYPNHYYFAINNLDYQGSGSDFFISQYGSNPNRFLYLASINYHKHLDKYVLELVSFDQLGCEGIEKLFNKVLATSYFGDKLVFHANKQEWTNCTQLPSISSEQLYEGQNYQALNLAKNYGFLRKVDIQDLPTTYLGKHDIVLLNDIPNDLSVVSGIITTKFQTPLSHINILSHNRATPNMALKNGWENTKLDTFLDKLVFLDVQKDSFVLRSAEIDEAQAFWAQREPQNTTNLEKDIETTGLITLSDASIHSVKTIGGKAANFAEMVNLGTIPLPENYFAIPFSYYAQHIANNGIDTFIDNMLTDETFKTDLAYRKAKLKALRKLIKNAPLDTALYQLVDAKINHFADFSSFRFRSSTNAEDLENFSGAGLYSSYSAKKDHPKKTIQRAIKKVWASLWNLRAFDERDYYKINQKSIAMGILVHRSFPDEDANGVIITKNLYNVNIGYTINVQYKEYSIVYPEPNILNDQILVYPISLNANTYTIEYLTHSNVPELNGESVLSNEEITELIDYCHTIKDYYYNHIPHNCNCAYKDFGLDIEFKVDSTVKNRKIYLKQVRLYSD